MVKGRFFSYSIDGSEEGRRSGSEAEAIAVTFPEVDEDKGVTFGTEFFGLL